MIYGRIERKHTNFHSTALQEALAEAILEASKIECVICLDAGDASASTLYSNLLYSTLL